MKACNCTEIFLTKDPEIKIGPANLNDKIISNNIMLVKKQKIESQNWKFEFFVNKVVFSFASNAKMLEVFRKIQIKDMMEFDSSNIEGLLLY